LAPQPQTVEGSGHIKVQLASSRLTVGRG